MTIDTEVAERFGALVAEGNYGEAHGYLTQAAGRENPPEVLKRDFEQMISYWQGDGEILEERLPSVVEVRSDLILED